MHAGLLHGSRNSDLSSVPYGMCIDTAVCTRSPSLKCMDIGHWQDAASSATDVKGVVSKPGPSHPSHIIDSDEGEHEKTAIDIALKLKAAQFGFRRKCREDSRGCTPNKHHP